MSLAVKMARASHGEVARAYQARARQMGDPGLFSFIGSALGTVAKGALGLATGGIPGLIGAVAPTIFPPAPGKSTQPQPQSSGGLIPLSSTGQSMPGTGVQVQFPNLGGLGGGGIAIGQFPGGGFTGGGAGTGMAVTPGQATGTQMCQLAGGGMALRATHANKSGYFLKSGQYVAAGSKCVTNRRMNPLNPRAASRAMRRIVAAKKATKFLGRISIRGGAKGCGCK